jgi:hypothetical protein
MKISSTTPNSNAVLEVHTGLPLENNNAYLTEPLLTNEFASEESASSSLDTEEAVLQFTCWDHLCLLVILPMLLILQFTMGSHDNDSLANNIDLHSVYGIIVLFVITAYLYRSSLNDVSVSNPYLLQILVLMPEILMDVILAIVLWKDAATAFLVLLLITLLLSGFVIVTTLSVLCCKRTQTLTAQQKEIVECSVV